MASIVEVHPRWLELVGANRWKGLRSFVTYSANAVQYAKWFHRQKFPGTSGFTAPTVRSVRAMYAPAGLTGRVLLACYYETQRVPGTAHVRARTRPCKRKQLKDRNGWTMEGPDLHSRGATDDKPGKPDGIHHWLLTGAINTDFSDLWEVSIETAYWADSFDWVSVSNGYRCVNKNRMSKLGAAKGTMLSVGARVDWEMGDDLLYVDHLFWRLGPKEKWNEQFESQKGIWSIQEVPVWTISPVTGTPSTDGRTRDMKVFLPAREWKKDGGVDNLVEVGPEAREPFEKYDFGKWDSMIRD